MLAEIKRTVLKQDLVSLQHTLRSPREKMHLLVKDEDVSVISSAERWEWLHVMAEGLARGQVRPFNVRHHPVEILGVFVCEVTIWIAENHCPERIASVVRQKRLTRGLFGLDDVA